MLDTAHVVILAAAALIGLAIVAGCATLSFRAWIALRRAEIGMTGTPAAGRIELADLRERVRKLEAIAAGVEL